MSQRGFALVVCYKNPVNHPITNSWINIFWMKFFFSHCNILIFYFLKQFFFVFKVLAQQLKFCLNAKFFYFYYQRLLNIIFFNLFFYLYNIYIRTFKVCCCSTSLVRLHILVNVGVKVVFLFRKLFGAIKTLKIACKKAICKVALK